MTVFSLNINYNKLLNFGIFFTKLPHYKLRVLYTNYYVLARRGRFLIINPFALGDFCSRVIVFFKQFSFLKTQCARWVFSFITKYSMLARWFAWASRSFVFSKLSREVSVVGKSGQYLCLDGNIASYTFMNFIGIDFAFVLSSQSSNGRAASLTDRGVLTIGFDGLLNPIYAYNCPGTRTTRSAILYARLLSILLSNCANL